MPDEQYATGNSHTQVVYNTDWLVLDIGSGHNPHPRANILADKYPLDTSEISGRGGRTALFSSQKPFVMADACAMPFRDKTFDFVICSHVVEHIEKINVFCLELSRIAHQGYVETPSKLAEILRHPPYHRWYVSNKKGTLLFEQIPTGYPLGWFGKLFFSIYFYKTIHVKGKDVFPFAHGCRKPCHYVVALMRKILVKLWLKFKPITYTRHLWKKQLLWEVKQR